MEIYNEQMELVENPDLSLGYLKDSVRIERHPAVAGVREQGHYEVIAEYENGGKDVEWVVDVPGIEAADAWDEKIPIRIYTAYTQAELEQMEAEKRRPTAEERIAALEEGCKRLNEMMENVLLNMSGMMTDNGR